MAKAPSKSITANNADIEKIVILHTRINNLATEQKKLKEEFTSETSKLKEDSKAIFDLDLGHIGDDGAPEIYGNHEYPVEDHLVTVNMKMQQGGLTFTQIGGKPAKDVLTGMMGEKDFKKLFKETPILKESPEKLREVHKSHPDLISRRLNISAIDPAILEGMLDKLEAAVPEAVIHTVKDEAAYIETIEDAEFETEVSTATGFIDKCASLPDDTKTELRDFIRKVLGSCVTMAVKCGNKADS